MLKFLSTGLICDPQDHGSRRSENGLVCSQGIINLHSKERGRGRGKRRASVLVSEEWSLFPGVWDEAGKEAQRGGVTCPRPHSVRASPRAEVS